jgi:medium-chain acyl-[acyl-carrier-protein] hydrolase
MLTSAKPLLVPLSGAGALTAFLFPFAGGSASAFRPWAEHFGAAFSVRAAQLPGRQNRAWDAPFERMADLAATLADEITATRGDFVFFGHSMGALTAFEVARELRRRRARLPALLGVSATPSPDVRGQAPPVASLSDDDLAESSRAGGGLPAEVMASEELLELVLPALRADLSLMDAYEYRPEPPLPVPLSIFGGLDDAMVAPDDLAAWRAQTTGRATVRMHPGGHFYLWEHGAAVVGQLLDDLEHALYGKDGSDG